MTQSQLESSVHSEPAAGCSPTPEIVTAFHPSGASLGHLLTHNVPEKGASSAPLSPPPSLHKLLTSFDLKPIRFLSRLLPGGPGCVGKFSLNLQYQQGLRPSVTNR